MSLLDETRFIEQPQFFDGQTLFAEDMQTVVAFNREMGWLHNRLLHQTGAIGNGYAVQGEKGARTVTIGPGLALDNEGREIVLIDDVVEPVPPVAGDEDGGPATFDLTVAYPDDDHLDVTETRIGLCDDVGAVRLREKPLITWVRLKKTTAGAFEAVDLTQRAAVKQGQMVVIARAQVLNCQLNEVLSLKQRRSARPSCRPYIGAGTASDLKWQIWLGVERDVLIDQLVDGLADLLTDSSSETGGMTAFLNRQMRFTEFFGGFEAWIDTSAAGFATTPHYSARIDGPRFQKAQLPVEDSPGDDVQMEEMVWFADGVLYVFDPAPAGFRVQMIVHFSNASIPLRLIDGAAIEEAGAAFAACLKENESDPLALRRCVVAYLEELDRNFAVVIPEEWQIVWMGVEG